MCKSLFGPPKDYNMLFFLMFFKMYFTDILL